jgi:hypothetical protein
MGLGEAMAFTSLVLASALVACGARTALQPGDASAPNDDGNGVGDGAGACPCRASCDGGHSAAGADGHASEGVLLFGGSDIHAEDLADTWLYDGQTWALQCPTNHPRARDSAAMASFNGGAVLFGGQDSNVHPLGDTWTWDGSNWTQRCVEGPSARLYAPMATIDGTAVLFGGFDNTNYFADTWTWDGEAWTEQRPVTRPGARADATMATLGDTVVLFGGADGNSSTWQDLDDTWTWDGMDWTPRDVTPHPSAREGAVMAALHGSLILFGGNEGDTGASDTWAWDGTAWTRRSDLDRPAGRFNATAASLSDTIVLFGGEYCCNHPLPGTWIWNDMAWTNAKVTEPKARFLATMSTVAIP